jgi:hypothetical protein
LDEGQPAAGESARPGGFVQQRAASGRRALSAVGAFTRGSAVSVRDVHRLPVEAFHDGPAMSFAAAAGLILR